LRSLYFDRSSGEAVRETSYYGALQNLLNAAGDGLRPKVRAIVNIRNRGAGIPDGGLFTQQQYERGLGEDAMGSGQLPERGAVEVKGVEEEVADVARDEQVGRYLEHYGQVFVTNYRAFLLVSRGLLGEVVELDSYTLAPTKEKFWELASRPQQTAAEQGERFMIFLRRAMLHGAPLERPEDVAWFLASYAREALASLESRTPEDPPALARVRSALEEALGLRFDDDAGEHFFRSTLVQTLFYGVFSAWVLWNKQTPLNGTERFDWRTAAYILKVPMIRALFEELARPSMVTALDLEGVLSRAGEVLNRVNRRSFFEKFEEEGAVTYFYEPFLEAFDPELKKQRGVWYTPHEVVSYMVERVNTVLQQELGLADGLADERVYVLDPCTGTGSYLVEILRRIKKTLVEKGEDALVAQDVKRAATQRVFGFEILPAPFVVAHLQLGLLLQNLGASLTAGGGERASVYLTNALTGWKGSVEKNRSPLPLPGLEEEREAAEEVKREKPVLVIIGNPPYNGYAGVGVAEERDLSDAYRTPSRAPTPRGQGLNDLYVRFYRVAERQIVEGTGQGVVCFISNYSWLDGLSFPGMRERYLEVFDRIWIDCLNGGKYKTGKVAPDGSQDPSIFSTEADPEGIQVGTAIALLVRKKEHEETGTVRFRHLWGQEKRAVLVQTAEQDGEGLYEKQAPPLGLGLPFVPIESQADYPSWPLLPELFPTSFSGVQTKQDDLVVDIDRARLVLRMEQYFDPEVSQEEVGYISPCSMQSTARFDAKYVRGYLQKRGFLPQYVRRYYYRPFDTRWIYWEPETRLLGEKSPQYFSQVFESNKFLFTTGRTRKSRVEPALSTGLLCDLNCMDSGARGIPLYLRPIERELSDGASPEAPVPNIAEGTAKYLRKITIRRKTFSTTASRSRTHWHTGGRTLTPCAWTGRASRSPTRRRRWPPRKHSAERWVRCWIPRGR